MIKQLTPSTFPPPKPSIETGFHFTPAFSFSFWHGRHHLYGCVRHSRRSHLATGILLQKLAVLRAPMRTGGRYMTYTAHKGNTGRGFVYPSRSLSVILRFGTTKERKHNTKPQTSTQNWKKKNKNEKETESPPLQQYTLLLLLLNEWKLPFPSFGVH